MCTWSSMALVCPADRQKRARASEIGVAGKPTTTTPIFLSSISLANALIGLEKRVGGHRTPSLLERVSKTFFSFFNPLPRFKSVHLHHFAWHVEQDGNHR